MADGFLVHASLLLFNFVTSIIHSTAGFGDAIVLHVLWLTATEVAPDIFNETALGDSPVKAVTLIMYCRVVIMTPVLAYLSFRDGIFLPQMITVMAVPSTLNALAGIFLFKRTSGDALKVVFGVSSLIFAILYAGILASKKTLCRRTMQRFCSGIWKCTRPIHLKSVDNIPASTTAKTYVSTNTGKLARSEKSAVADSADVGGTSAVTFASTTAGSLLTHRESVPQWFTESAPVSAQLVLTSPVARPTSTHLVTCSHINRNLSDDDRNKIATRLGASCAAAVSGMMGSLTGVADPAHIIFISLLDVPAYMMRVNLIMQSLPSAALRFTFACSTAMFKKDMAPLLFTSVVGGYAGLVAGMMLGRVLGPESRNVFVLALLLLASLVVLTHSGVMLVALVLGCTVVTAVAALNEHQEAAIEVEVRHAIEGGLEARRRKSSVSPDNNTSLAPDRTPATNPPASPVRSRSGTSGNRGRHDTLDRTQQCSTWVRRADLMRPPPLWDDDGNPSQRLPPAARKNIHPTPPTPTPSVSSAAELERTAVGEKNTASDPVVTALPPLCQQDMCTEEARRSAESPCEEPLYVSVCDVK